MAKKTIKKTGFSLQGFDVNHYKQTEGYVQAIDVLYAQAINEFARVAGGISLNPDKPFSFSDYPQARNKAQQIVSQLASKMQAVVVKGSRDQWLYACKKNDEFLKSILNTSRVPKKVLSKYQDRNLDALDSFQKRKVAGLDLSQRVWNYAGQMKTQMELGIDIAVGEGKPAAQLSKELKQYLVDPDKLFRKVRDKHGNLVLSKNAQAFHPGQGKYRSSYKNAMRLTRSEINMAYRQSDQLRWQKLDFVVGYEIRLSNNHTTLINGVPTPFKDICDDLAGKYPKSFVFKGWHPQCRCQAFPILQDRDEFNDDEVAELKAALNGTEYKKFESKNKVTDVPANFKDWVASNLERSQNWTSNPYFIRDNFAGGNLAGGLKIATTPQAAAVQPAKVVTPPPAPAPKPATTEKYVPADIKKDSTYLKGKKIEFKDEFFALVDPNKPVKLFVETRGKGSYYQPGARQVHIVDNSRNRASDWHRESVVYHEYGHAIDDQRGLRYSQDVLELMKKHNTEFKKKGTYTRFVAEYSYADRKMVYRKETSEMSQIGYLTHKMDQIRDKVARMNPEVFKRRGITKDDVIEQLCSTADAIKAININFGYGHTTSYFRRAGMRETEFLAHCFENAFVGNTVFKKYLPELYNDMIKYVKSLKAANQ